MLANKLLRVFFVHILAFGLVAGAAGCSSGGQGSVTDKAAEKAAAPEKFPNKPVRIVATHTAGGVTDTVARLIQPYLQNHLGVPVVIENMDGAGGNIARSYVYKQPADGYTLLVSQQPSLITGAIVSGGDFDPLGFTHVYNLVGKNYLAVAVPDKSPFKDMKDIVNASKTRQLSVGTAGVGSASYLATILLKEKYKANVQDIPFGSGSENAMAVAGGQVDFGFPTLATTLPLYQQKKVRIIATTGPERAEQLPEAPTVIEQGFPDFMVDAYTSIFAPPGVPKDRLDALAAAFDKAFKEQAYLDKVKAAKYVPLPLGPDEFYRESQKMFQMIKELEPALKATSKK